MRFYRTSSVQAKRVAHPVDALPSAGVPIDADDVESARAVTKLAVAGEEHGRSLSELALLARIDRERRIDRTRRAPEAHFDEHEAVAVAHDEIELAAAGVEIAGDGCQAATLQKGARLALGIVP